MLFTKTDRSKKMTSVTMQKVISETCHDQTEADLFRAVIRQIPEPWGFIYNEPENYRRADGGVSGFIYYADTHKFTQRHIQNILEVLTEFEDEIGCPLEKPGDKLNWFAWFALEHTIQKIMDYKESNQ
jgi:hypothetical protein